MKERIRRLLEGHISAGPITLYGLNAHVALEIKTKRGYLSFHPGWGEWPWSLYLSPNATPWAATFARGPGLDREDVLLAPVRNALFGHGFDTDLLADYAPYVAIAGDAEAVARSMEFSLNGALKPV